MSYGETVYRTTAELPHDKLWMWVGDQLGKAYRSNNSGDGPESGDARCHDLASRGSHPFVLHLARRQACIMLRTQK